MISLPGRGQSNAWHASHKYWCLFAEVRFLVYKIGKTELNEELFEEAAQLILSFVCGDSGVSRANRRAIAPCAQVG